MDYNGDGILDRMTISTDGTTPTAILQSNGGRPSLLSKIEFPQGGSYEFTHKFSAQYKDASGALLNIMPTNIVTVEKIVMKDGIGGVSEIRYEYSGGAMYYDALVPTDRRFAGFEKVVAIRDGERITTYYHQGNDPSGVFGEGSDGFVKIGRSYRKDVSDNNGNLYV